MKNKFSLLKELFLCFFKVGAFTFGGGYAMISLIHHACVEERQWITEDEMINITAIAESTPGPIAINCATYVGFKLAGLSGACFATLGIVLPSLLIIYIISVFFDGLLSYPLVAKAFRGIKIGVGVVILSTGLTMVKKMSKKTQPRIIAACSFAIMLLSNIFALKISTITLLLAAAAVSLSVFVLKGGDRA